MADPDFSEGRNRAWKQMRTRFTSTTQGERSIREGLIEDERRKEDEPAQETSVSVFANTPPSPGTPYLPPTPTSNDRFHKKGRIFVSVSPAPDWGDPIPDPAYKHTITEGYAYLRDVIMPQVDSDERGELHIYGGLYKEDVVFDDPRIDVIGFGRPIVEGQVKLSTGCTKITILSIDVYNPTSDSADPFPHAGLFIESGTMSGTSISDVRFIDCEFYGSLVQVFCKRWAYFQDCKSFSLDNVNSTWPSMYFLYDDGIPGGPGDPVHPAQTKWTNLIDCEISGQNHPTIKVRKGPAIYVDGRLHIALTNTFIWAYQVGGTGFSTGGVPSSYPSFGPSGVYLQGCKVTGWTANYGWQMKHNDCICIQGKYINDTAGSVHHLVFHYSAVEFPVFYAKTWYNDCEIAVRYISEAFNADILDPGLSTAPTIWLRFVDHSSPDVDAALFPAGSACIAGDATSYFIVFVGKSETPATWWFLIGPPPAEGAIISDSTVNVQPGIEINPLFDL